MPGSPRYLIAVLLPAAAAGVFLWGRATFEAPGAAGVQASDAQGAHVVGGAATDEQAILAEAAQKRFGRVSPRGALASIMPSDEKQAEELMGAMAVELLEKRLVVEKMQQDPFFKDAIEQEMRRREPRLMRLTQTLEGGFQAEQWVVVIDTTACALQDGSTHEVLVDELEDRFCMHPLLEYPGGFDESRPLALTVHPFEDIATQPDAEIQWSKWLLLEAKQAVTAELVDAYRRDGRLSF